ncbi:hypothetical protein NP777_35765 [Streptomyces sp. RCU064]|uniref:Uncharacterized protein n=1 Tax=Streptomyces rugosispiralis TaxID=2967341 RepID=A0ABT1V802_9ACTN|nr:hypothetical protein [Streptomyces rugosispiralis]
MQRTEGDRWRRQNLADISTGHVPRLLPWTTDDGRPCLLSGADDGGYVSKLADEMEAAQLGMGTDVLEYALKVLKDTKASHGELRYVGTRLAECLSDALRVAESRGMRLPVPDKEESAVSPTPAAETSA